MRNNFSFYGYKCLLFFDILLVIKVKSYITPLCVYGLCPLCVLWTEHVGNWISFVLIGKAGRYLVTWVSCWWKHMQFPKCGVLLWIGDDGQKPRPSNPKRNTPSPPSIVAARSKVCTVFYRPNTGIFGSNLTLCTDICLRFSCGVLPGVRGGSKRAHSFSQECYQISIKNLSPDIIGAHWSVVPCQKKNMVSSQSFIIGPVVCLYVLGSCLSL